MKNTIKHFRILFLLMLVLDGSCFFAQITEGKIIFERKTNLFKKFKGNSAEWIKEENKNKLDYFELYFNDTASCFKPQENELKEKMGWATEKSTTFQNFKNGKLIRIKSIWGEKVYLSDSLKSRTWKITDSKRTIGGFLCRKAIWKLNDSTRIYAWYTDQIILSSGPETFNGLPGMILGLATEDGGIVYFAKSVEIKTISLAEIEFKKGKEKFMREDELRKKLSDQFGKEPWGKTLLKETFDVW